MTIPHLPLNALRAFEAAARHLSFTRAASELRVTQAAVSHQVKGLEDTTGVLLFRRLPRGLALTEEGEALYPVLTEAFRRIASMLDRVGGGLKREVLTVGVVGTFATGWLLPRLHEFRAAHPDVDLRLLTNNNLVDLAGEGLDCAIRFGDGAWHGTDATRISDAEFSPVCAPRVAVRLRSPADLAGEDLLRSYRPDEWPLWFAAAGVSSPAVRGLIFDSSVTMAEAAMQGAGVALVPVGMFERDLLAGRLVQPFGLAVSLGSYWFTRNKSRPETAACNAFRRWLTSHARPDAHLGAVVADPTEEGRSKSRPRSAKA